MYQFFIISIEYSSSKFSILNQFNRQNSSKKLIKNFIPYKKPADRKTESKIITNQMQNLS